LLPVVTGSEFVPSGTGGATAFDEGLGFFCTTTNDACGNPTNVQTLCTFDLDAGHWAWGYSP
jgi:hypothetical protein